MHATEKDMFIPSDVTTLIHTRPADRRLISSRGRKGHNKRTTKGFKLSGTQLCFDYISDEKATSFNLTCCEVAVGNATITKNICSASFARRATKRDVPYNRPKVSMNAK